MKSIVSALDPAPSGEPVPVSGGCIHDCYRWGPYFIKINTSDHDATFRSEANGLRTIAQTEVIRVPAVISQGVSESRAFLILEYLDLVSDGDEALLGEQLAALHSECADRFGFREDNFIGATPQSNAWTDDWPTFFRDHRIGRMLKLLECKGITFPHAESLLERLPELLPDRPRSSLLHGDLWGGNKAFLADGTPVVFDPACYYGHAACDIAMATLFGGFGQRFHDAYRNSSDGDQPSLHPLYNLYHILNHALLFGGAYVREAGEIIRRFS